MTSTLHTTKKVLSIQSHVIHGYVGNKAATFPLQYRGWDVDVLNTVQFSNHPGYAHFTGFKCSTEELVEIVEKGLVGSLHIKYDAVLSGYLPNVQALQKMAGIVGRMCEEDDNVKWVLDPVPVSYTHLDVYKRQGNNSTTSNMIQNNGAKEEETVGKDGTSTTLKLEPVKWQYDPNNPVDFDGLDIKRPGSENVECTIRILRKSSPEEPFMSYSPELARIIGLKRGTLHDAIFSIYKYIHLNELLTDDESAFETSMNIRNNHGGNTNSNRSLDAKHNQTSIVKLDFQLLTLLPSGMKESSRETMRLMDLLALINAHLLPLEPIAVSYTHLDVYKRQH